MATESQRSTFISYSRINEAFALELAKELKSAGYSVWLDQLDIPTGARWDDEIEKALSECSIFLAILTPAFIESENAKDEIGYAIDHGKRILPVLLEECEIPLRLTRIQYVDFTKMDYKDGLKSAKELLEKLIKEESIPRPVDITESVDSVVNEPDLTASKERPTQPTKSRPSQSLSDRTDVPFGMARSQKKPFLQRSSTLFVSIGFIVILILVASLGFGTKILPFLNPTPTFTQEVKPTDTSAPRLAATTEVPTSVPDRSYFDEFDSSSAWEQNWDRIVKHGNEKNIHFSINNGQVDWQLDDKYLSVYYLYKEDFNFAESSVQMDLEFKDLTFLNTKITDPAISFLGLVCGYNDTGWYEVNLHGGIYKIVRRAGYQQTINAPPNRGLKEWKFGEDTNKVTVICNSNGISVSANGGTPFKYQFGVDEAKLDVGRVGIALTSDKDFPVSVQLLSIKVSEP
jgi:hypothetical protein